MAQVLNFSKPVNALTTTALFKTRQFAPRPQWLIEMLREIEPYQERIWNCPLVKETSKGVLSLQQMRGWLIQLYPFVETFPQWIALNIAKAPDAFSREILIDNVRVEKWHAKQWIEMAEAFGLTQTELTEASILPEVEALTHFMWSINLRGTLAESISAMTCAIEGTTQGIAQAILQGFQKYDGREGIYLTKGACAWMNNHARYDQIHLAEALEIITRVTQSEETKIKVGKAAKRSMEYLLMALDACYQKFALVGISEDVSGFSC